MRAVRCKSPILADHLFEGMNNLDLLIRFIEFLRSDAHHPQPEIVSTFRVEHSKGLNQYVGTTPVRVPADEQNVSPAFLKGDQCSGFSGSNLSRLMPAFNFWTFSIL